MKKKLLKTTVSQTVAVIAATLFFLNLGAELYGQKIEARALTPREIDEAGLPGGTQTSGGLMTVGLGEIVYLEVQVPKGTVVNAVEWSILQRPVGNSEADFQPTPIPSDMPIYSLGDRAINDVASRTSFTPDVAGQYKIEALVKTADSDITLEATITGAYYTGVGLMGGTTAKYPQCALCHEEQAIKFMGTGHASFLATAIDGLQSSHYSENCMSCHALGTTPGLENGGFAQVAEDIGWTFPVVLKPGNWEAMPAELKAMSNVQCEHCHGAGSEHHGDATATSVSLSAGDCGQCHDDEPYHTKNAEWNLSRHAVTTRYPTGEGRAACVRCHSGVGFIEHIKGETEFSTDYEAITCAVCHDPHDATNEHQVRSVSDVTLQNGFQVTEGGTGKLCMNCHKSRQDGEGYSAAYHSHFGPHGSPQTDMLVGNNAVDYDETIGSSTHIYALEDACASCHMQTVAMSDPASGHAGGHTFKPVFDNGTPDDASDDVDLVGACVKCHGPMDSFDIKKLDYNNDGVVEGVQTEIKKIMEQLALKLPPLGENKVEVVSSYTPEQLKAAYNYLFVESDGSMGIHNTRYAVGILKASMSDLLGGQQNRILRGQNIPVGGEWFYSSWLGFYAPKTPGVWAFSLEHGYLYISGTPENVNYYDYNMAGWMTSGPGIFPNVYSYKDKSWMYYGGSFAGTRWFYNYSTGQWISKK